VFPVGKPPPEKLAYVNMCYKLLLLYPYGTLQKTEICIVNNNEISTVKYYKDISSFSKDVGVSAPEHPHFSVAFGHQSDGSIDDIVFTAGFYIISFLNFVSGNITYEKQNCNGSNDHLGKQ
jgi:hypothetical protein